MKRNDFVTTGIFGVAGLMVSPIEGAGNFQEPNDPIRISAIREFVAAGHNDLAKVKMMLAETPNLLYCRYDWGGGDFEEAIEGAGHVGNKEIANYLIHQGARANLFVLTMLGKKSIVIPTLQEYPNLVYAKGPHGFSLLHHARIGGEGSREIYDYLVDKGLGETKFKIR